MTTAADVLAAARPVNEDSGDVAAYFNVTDFVKSKDGKPITPDAAKVAEGQLQRVVESLGKTFADEVRKSLRSNGSWARELATVGLELK